ncbi:protein of unknown function [Methylorubrum extorquens]|uniref:Uncharacterized protein n=1 Tax=Methylorubrum extorquens TaxID=408 RepID=A0A2N9AHP6_METEX|nr:protein of unknown function [Methylorubrum extorquens]
MPARRAEHGRTGRSAGKSNFDSIREGDADGQTGLNGCDRGRWKSSARHAKEVIGTRRPCVIPGADAGLWGARWAPMRDGP